MEIVYLVVGVVVGGFLGYLWAARKSVSLRSELQMNQQHAQDLLKAEKERTELLIEQYRKETERLRGQVDDFPGNGQRQVGHWLLHRQSVATWKNGWRIRRKKWRNCGSN